jgi:multidrug efflux system membrane fusion protein
VHAAITAELFKSAAIVPASAIFPGEEGGTSVVVIRDNVAHRRVVQVGVRDGDRVQIVSGVNPGEEIVIQGGMGVDDGAKVKVVDTTGKEDLDEEPDAPEAAPANKEQKKGEGKPKAK